MRSEDPDLLAAAQHRRFAMPRQQVVADKAELLEDGKDGRAARKGWLGLVSYLEPNGDLRNVCQGTAKKNDLQYYLDRQRLTGDLHGQAPVLWCATALLR